MSSPDHRKQAFARPNEVDGISAIGFRERPPAELPSLPADPPGMIAHYVDLKGPGGAGWLRFLL